MRALSTSPTGRQQQQQSQQGPPRRLEKRSSSFPPPGGPATYRDLLRFEQRLVQNAEALARQRRKYQLFLGALVVSILLLAYKVLLHPSIYSLVQYAHLTILLIATTTLVLFFATGMYTEKIARGYKFVPQANHSLRPFNLHLATGSNNKASPSAPSSASSSSGLFGSLKRRKSSKRKAAAAAANNPNSAPPPVTRSESSQHPLSELIFSSRVDPEFQRGYEQFREEWKRRKASGAASGSKGNSKLKPDQRRPDLAGQASGDSVPMVSDEDMTYGRGRPSRRSQRSDESLQSSPTSSRSPSPQSARSPRSRLTSSTSLSSGEPVGPRTPSDDSSDYELSELVDTHIKGGGSEGQRADSDDEYDSSTPMP